jgi:hypothetical protein
MKRYKRFEGDEGDEVVLIISKLSDVVKQVLKDKDNFKLDKKSISYLFWKEGKKEFNTLDYGKIAITLNNIIKELKKYKLIKYYKVIDYGKRGDNKRGKTIAYRPDTTTLGDKVIRQL